MEIFLAGGTGFVGGHVRSILLEKGHAIRLLSHRRTAGAANGVQTVPGDVTRPETWADALQGCDAAINLVGIIREFPGRGVTFDKLHVQATEKIIGACRKAGIKRYLHMSALGARPGATSMYHRTKFGAEEHVRASGLDYTIFRPSIIFGPKDGFVNMLAGYIRSYPAVPVIGDGNYRLQPIAADDVALCFAGSLHMPGTIGHTYELCGPDRMTYNEMLDIIGRSLGKDRVTKLKTPAGFVKLAAGLLQGFSFFPITLDQIAMLMEESICDGKWRETFRFEPTGFVEGIRGYLPG
ncbi:MAG TPA: complex I NDUFA9 subunit family protein [Geobacteraceae bacterium]|nr:complex I NDUFA9 subunit family protein [Geobacteraceae bacterium]